MKKFLCLLLFLIQISIIPAILFAQQNTDPKKFALVIGNGAYKNVTKLDNPANDADDMSVVLRKIGFTVDVLFDADLHQMEDAVIRLKDRLSASDNSYGFFYYAGHGIQSNGENYLLPVDANIPTESFLRDRSISVQAVLDELNDAHNVLNIVVLDACRDNPFGWVRSTASRGLALVSHQPADSIIVYATSAGSTASDGDSGNGLFTSQLIQNLLIPGIEVSDLFKLTGADVANLSNKQQIPAIYNQFFGTAYLGEKPAGGASVLVRSAQYSNINNSPNLWSIGITAGTSFAAPFFVGTVFGTFAPFKYSFFELGMDLGLISGSKNYNYYSFSPFLHYALFVPVARAGGFFAGVGGSYNYAVLDFPDKKVPLNIVAFDAMCGFRFNMGILISYTFRTDFSTASNKLTVGYSFRY
ncbi:MAG: caspase family protein [Treponema sp.]|nr:caspase family protein [Treponema sp.]